MSEFPSIEKLREAVSSEGRVVDQLCDSFSNHTWVRLNLVNPIRLAFSAARFLLSVVESGGRLVVEAPCEHGALEPHGWVCGEHDTDETCPRQNCEAYLDFGNHCAGLHRDDDACWSAWACGGGSRRRVFPKGE